MARDDSTQRPRSGSPETIAELRARESLLAGEVLELKAEVERLRREAVRHASRTAVLQDRDDRWRERAEQAELRADRLAQELKNAHADARVVSARVVELGAAVAERDKRLSAVGERLARRAHELTVVYDSKGYRLVRWSWRVRRRLRHPFTRSNRPARPASKPAAASVEPVSAGARAPRDQADEPPALAVR